MSTIELAFEYQDRQNNRDTGLEKYIDDLTKRLPAVRDAIERYVNSGFETKTVACETQAYPYKHNLSESYHAKPKYSATGKIKGRQREKMIARALCLLSKSGKRLPLDTELSFGHDLIIESDLGKFIDYEVPLFRKGNRKIDLISVKNNSLYIIELKRHKSNETLVRCLMEAFSYYLFDKLANRESLRDKDRFKGHLTEAFGLNDSSTTVVCPLIFKGSRAWNDLKAIKDGEPLGIRILQLVQEMKRIAGTPNFGVSCAVIDPYDTRIRRMEEWPCDSDGRKFAADDWLEL